MRYTFIHFAPISALLLLSCGCPLLQSGLKRQNVPEHCFEQNATIDGTLSGDYFVGYAHVADIVPKKNPTSPTIRLAGGQIISGPYILKPGQTSLGGITLYNKSVLQIEDGFINGYATAKHSSKIVMRGGKVAGNIDAYDTASLTINGGTIEYNLLLQDKGTAVVNGGTINGVGVTHNTVLTMNGGNFTGYMSVNGLGRTGSTVHIRGGTMPRDSFLSDGARVYIYGTNLAKKQLKKESLAEFTTKQYRLTGTLADGTKIDGCTMSLQNRENSSDTNPKLYFVTTTKAK